MAAGQPVLPCSLRDLLSNALILRHTSPYLGVRSLVSLAATSKAYRSLIYDTLQVFQHVDLSGTGVLTCDAPELLVFNDPEFDGLYARRFSTIFSLLKNRNVLQDVRTLILDGLYVPTTVIDDILSNKRYQIRLLSIRDVPKPTPNDMLRILNYLFKPSHLKEISNVRALYLFGRPSRVQEVLNFEDVKTRPESITASIGAQLGAGNHTADSLDDFQKLLKQDPYSDSPYGAPGVSYVLSSGRVISEWAEILKAYAGLMAFDAVLCRHDRDSVSDSRPRLATVRLTGCVSCGTCPEGPAYPGVSPSDHIPLLSPLPLHSWKVEVAQRIETPGQPYPPLILRCRTCLKDRWCEMCNAWWCESCYTIPQNRKPDKKDPVSSWSDLALNDVIKEKVECGVDIERIRALSNSSIGSGSMIADLPRILKGSKRHCYECGQQCQQCQALTQRICSSCPNQYCLKHDTGCSSIHCAWCNTGGQRGALLDY